MIYSVTDLRLTVAGEIDGDGILEIYKYIYKKVLYPKLQHLNRLVSDD